MDAPAVSGILHGPPGAIGRTTERIRLRAAAAPHALPALVLEDAAFVDRACVDFHRRHDEGQEYDLAALRMQNITLGGNGWIWQGSKEALSDTAVAPLYAQNAAAAAPHALRERFLDLPVRREPRRGLVLQGWGVNVYGHFLIETLPRLLLMAASGAEIFAPFAPVLDRNSPPWLLEILTRHCGIDPGRAIFFDPEGERLALDDAIILPLGIREGFHPAIGPLLDRLVARATGEVLASQPSRLFIRRRGYLNPQSGQRILENEQALADIAAQKFGFTVIEPQTLPWLDQIRIFAGAATIVGEYGSALHNALFAPPGTTVGAIRFANAVQSQIAALRGHRIAYLTAGLRETGPGRFAVDAQRFERFLDRLVEKEQKASFLEKRSKEPLDGISSS